MLALNTGIGGLELSAGIMFFRTLDGSVSHDELHTAVPWYV